MKRAGDRLFDVLALGVELLLCCLPIGTLAYVTAAAGINAGATLLGLVMVPAYFAGRFAAARQLEHLQRRALEIIERAERDS